MIPRLIMRALGAIDERSADQIRAETREELGHHIECLCDELRRGGAMEEELDGMIAERFGDADRYAAECTRIALRERVMLQRINFGLLILLGVAVAWSAWGTTQASARSAAALDKLSQRLETLDLTRRPAPPAAAAPADDGEDATVMVSGSKTVGRQGVYSMGRHGSLTVRRVLAAASFSPDHWKAGDFVPIRVLRLTRDGINEVVFSLSRDDYARADGKDFVLLAGDLVQAP